MIMWDIQLTWDPKVGNSKGSIVTSPDVSAQRHLQSPVTWLFVQVLVQGDTETSKPIITKGNPQVTHGLTSERGQYSEKRMNIMTS